MKQLTLAGAFSLVSPRELILERSPS